MPADSSLRSLLTIRRIRALASGASFERGEGYVAEGRVRSLIESGNTLTATIHGTENYSVHLAAKNGALAFRCSCPMGGEGTFCKHNVAVALAWLAANKDAGNAVDGAPSLVKLDELRPWLLEQDKTALIAWLLDAATHDERLREKLLRQAARASSCGVDLRTYRRVIDRATPEREFFDYRETHGLADRIRDAIEQIAELLAEGEAIAVMELCEYALARMENMLNNADDSDGQLGACLGELQDLHLKACEAARPDPEELAARLFDWETTSDWDVFYGAVETYAGVLGEKGLALYRARAEAAWKSLPKLKPGAREELSSQRFRITSIMESLARTSGNVDALVAIKSKDLSHAYSFFQIAELYRGAKRDDLALEWAERGLKAFPNRTDPRLIEFLAEEYHRRKRHDEALALIWRQFEEQPSLENYRLLKRHADHQPDSWATWRQRALACFRSTADKSARNSPGSRFAGWSLPSADRSELVRVFLWEKEIETAWQEAQEGGCHSGLWLELAASRADTHPGESAAIYVREAERLIDVKSNRAYEDAVRMLTKAKALFARAGNVDVWTSLISRLRFTHKAKRNFIAAATKL